MADNVANNVSGQPQKFSFNFKLAFIIFILVDIILFTVIVILPKLFSPKQATNNQTASQQKAATAKEKVLQELQHNYATATSSFQGTIQSINSRQQELVVQQILNGKKTTMTVKVLDSAFIYERPTNGTAELKKLTFDQLKIGQYITASGKKNGDTLEATTLTADPMWGRDEYPTKAPPKK